MKLTILIVSIIFALALIIWIGLRVNPKPFSMPSLPNLDASNVSAQRPATVPIPSGLPAPVDRFYRAVYGDEVPVVDTVVITGRGRIRPFGIWLPARFVFVHNTGRDYRHYFEATFFGLPFLRVDEGIIDGESFFESPMGTYYNDPNTNQGANLALWAEGGWFPSVWLTDSRARWEAVDESTALLRVPYGAETETFVVRFNPTTGLVDMTEAMRYKTPSDKQKTLWITSSSADGSVAYATWLDDGKSWAELSLEQIAFNSNVSEYIQARGK